MDPKYVTVWITPDSIVPVIMPGFLQWMTLIVSPLHSPNTDEVRTLFIPILFQLACGANFTSKVFTQILRELGIQHQLASAYHPESQDALERFHQTLKSML